MSLDAQYKKPVDQTPEQETFETAEHFDARNRYRDGFALGDESPPEYFEKRIRRNPKDLNAHCLRLRHYQSQKDGPGCFAALVDLFIVLGARGSELRKRLLDQSGSLLPRHLRDFLEEHIESGISARTPLPCVQLSILTDAISGTTELFTDRSSSKSA